MADNYTLFSVKLPLKGTEEEIKARKDWLEEVLREESYATSFEDFEKRIKGLGIELPTHIEDTCEWPSFEHSIYEEEAYLYSEEHGDLENVAEVLRAYLAKFDPTRIVAFQWADTCSKPRPDEFGGGACVVTVNRTHWMSTVSWLEEKLTELAGDPL